MKKLRCTLFLYLVILHWHRAFPQPTVVADEGTKKHLAQFRSDYIQSLLQGTTAHIAPYYHEQIRLMPEFQKTIKGKADALRYHQAFASRFVVQRYTRNEMEILDLGTRIVEVGLFEMNLQLKSNLQHYELKGKYMNIWESLNGKWTLITECWNYNHPTDLAQQLVFSEVPAFNVALESHLPVNTNLRFELSAYNRLQESIISEHDAAIWSLYYSDDALFLYSNSPVYRGRKEIDQFLTEHVRHLPIFEKLDIRNDRIDVTGDYIIEYASHIAIVRNGEWSGVSTGKDIRIWRREKDHSLKIFREVAMYD